MTYGVGCGIIKQIMKKGRYSEMDDGDSTDTTCKMCIALVADRTFYYIS